MLIAYSDLAQLNGEMLKSTSAGNFFFSIRFQSAKSAKSVKSAKLTEGGRQQAGDRSRKTGDGRQETEDRRLETGDGRQEMGAGRLRGLFDVISKKFYTYNLAGEFDKFLRTLIANRKYKLAVPVAAKSAKWG